jgi:hypothetical protein
MLAPLLGAEDRVGDMVKSDGFLWVVGALVATLLVGAVLLKWLERWRKRQLTDTPANDVQQLGSFRSMFERGELTKEEYDRIKRKEAARLRDKMAGKGANPAPIGKSPPAAFDTIDPEPSAQSAPQEPETPPPAPS